MIRAFRREFAGAGAGERRADFSTVTAGEAALKVAQVAPPRCKQPGNISSISISTPWRRKRNGGQLNIFCPAPTIDVAVMAPVPPARFLQTPLLIGGPQAEAIAPRLQGLGLNARWRQYGGPVSAIKMCRSGVMIKVLKRSPQQENACSRPVNMASRRRCLVPCIIVSSLGLDRRARLSDQPVAEHGIRRSEEMEEVVKTLRDVGAPG